jgi:hypothetical protein
MTEQDYEASIPARLKDNALWPAFQRPTFLSELDGLADDAIMRGTHDSYLGAMLIYSQLAEEIARLLLADAEFFVQLHLYPHEIHLAVQERATLGELIGALKRAIVFQGRDVVLSECQALNDIRGELVHRLTRKSSLDGVKADVEAARTRFQKLFAGFQEAHSFFWLYFKDCAKDDTWWERVEEGG